MAVSQVVLGEESAVGQLPLTPQDLEDPVTPQQEHLRRVERAQKVTSLDADLFGDTVNAYTGATQFRVTDVAIEGNSKLRVDVTRRFDVNTVRGRGARSRSGSVFEDWDLELPHMHGVFAASTGWQAGPTPGVRCAQPFLAQAAPPTVSGIEPDDYWQGNQLYVPGIGDDEISHLGASAPDRPTDGATYQWVTKGLWYFSCLPSTANGVTGDAFLARDPDGNRYWFNQVIEKLYAPLVRGTTTPLARREIVILPTRIEDRFGNWVTYTYSTSDPRNLLIIEANDGRRIDLTYEVGGGPGGRIRTVTTGSRTWTYGYNASVIGASLTSVTRPDGSSYVYDFSTFHEEHVDVAFDNCGSTPGFVYSFDFVATITHPSGAVGTFTFKYKQHGRTFVPQNCWSAGGDSGDRFPPIFTALSLTQKQISGTGLAGPMTWQWTYPALVSGYTSQCVPSCPTTKIISTTQPDGSIVQQTFGIRYGQNEGLLLSSDHIANASTLRAVTFAYQFEPAGQLYRPRIGDPIRLYPDASIGVFKPRVQQTTSQQGVTFSWNVNNNAGVYSFDRFARPLAATSSNGLGFSTIESQTYFDQDTLWVLGLPSAATVNGTTTTLTTYYSATALPQDEYRFGQKTRTTTYRVDGTIETVTDNLSHTTTLSDWKRGLPQSVAFQDGATRSAIIDNNGWVQSVTDEVGGTTSYLYDALGRTTSINYPFDPTNAWAATARSFSPIGASEFGLPVGTWKQVIATGNYRKHVWFDVLWRPILEREWDNSDPIGTQRFVRRTFDDRGNPIFESFAASSITTINDLAAGTTRTFDSLDRLLTETSLTELGNSVTSYDYVVPFETRVTNPRGFQTRFRYFALAEPTTEFPIQVERGINGPLSEQSLTTIQRDVFGKVLSMERSGNGASATRTLRYDTQQRLCQLTEPESGALVLDYDLGGNVAWTAEGRAAAASCATARASVPIAERVIRVHDERNRLTQIDYPETLGIATSDVVLTYEDDGALHTATMGDASWTYTYNSLRRLELEQMSFDGRQLSADWQFDTHGAVSGLVYPNGEVVSFTPNALGQQTRSGAIATNATYHANGAPSGWTFGNGIIRSLTQTTRKLPDRLRDIGGSVVFDEDYNYDANANVQSIVDGRDSLQNRTLGYDAQDRLTSASGAWGAGNLTYDGADNLKTQLLGVKNYTYNYNQQKLATVTNGPTTLVTLGYDARGNQTQKNGQLLTWDIANRVALAAGKSRYRYDAHGRRLLVEPVDASNQPTGERTLQFYSRDGALLYQERNGPAAPDANRIFGDGFESGPQLAGITKTTFHYLGATLVGRRDTAPGNVVSTAYLHTDVQGSVVAETNASQSVVRRLQYQPFGLSSGGLSDGPNFSGHVLDSATGLVYMRGRYYDPDLGRFLSMDPTAPSLADGGDFNRYAYARNNPYRNVDPNGEIVETLWDVANIGIGIASFGQNVALGNVGAAAIDALGVVVDGLATAVPLIPGGAGTLIKAARAGERVADAVSTAKTAEKIADARSVANVVEDAAKRGPNPYGKAGGPAHQAKVEEVAADIRSRGLEAVPEHRVLTPEGCKSCRYVDVVGKDANGKVVEMHQVGRQTAAGNPVAREVKALDDIQKAADVRPEFHPYN